MSDFIELIKGVTVKKGIYYSKEHVWIEKIKENLFKIGLAQPKIVKRGPISYFNISAEVGSSIIIDDVIAEIETSKSLIYIHSPFNGIVETVNDTLLDVPEFLRSDTYSKGWIVTIKVTECNELNLLNEFQYIDFVKEEMGSRIGLTDIS